MEFIILLFFIGVVIEALIDYANKPKIKLSAADNLKQVLKGMNEDFPSCTCNDRSAQHTKSTPPTYVVPDAPSNLMYITKQQKQQYMQSSQWSTLKQQRLAIANHQCESANCQATTNLECHHLTYERLTQENLDDLLILCRYHHQQIHDKLGYDRATTYNI